MSPNTSLKILYKVCTYTNCFPHYNFEEFVLHSSGDHVIYVLVVICLVLSQFIWSTYGRCNLLHMEFSILIADTFSNISLCTCNILSCLLCYNFGNKYMNKLVLLNANFENYPKDVRRNFPDVDLVRKKMAKLFAESRSICTIILVHIVFGLLVVFDVYATCKLNMDRLWYYIFKHFQYYSITTLILYTVFAMRQIKTLVMYIQQKLLEDLNNFLHPPVAEMKENTQGLFTLTGWTKIALNGKGNTKDVSSIALASAKYKDIYLLCYYYNAIFEWPILFVVGFVLFNLIQTMNYVVQYPEEHPENNPWMLCLMILTSLYFYALQTWMIISCDSVTEEVIKFANMIYKQILIVADVQQTFAEQIILKDMISLWYHISNNKPCFYAGFIVLKRKFIYGSFIGISSFIAVIVEFNRVVFNHHDRHKFVKFIGNVSLEQ